VYYAITHTRSSLVMHLVCRTKCTHTHTPEAMTDTMTYRDVMRVGKLRNGFTVATSITFGSDKGTKRHSTWTSVCPLECPALGGTRVCGPVLRLAEHTGILLPHPIAVDRELKAADGTRMLWRATGDGLRLSGSKQPVSQYQCVCVCAVF
jgi:hypothetical protein